MSTDAPDTLENCELTALHVSALLSLAIAWSKKKKTEWEARASLAPKVKDVTLSCEMSALPHVISVSAFQLAAICSRRLCTFATYWEARVEAS